MPPVGSEHDPASRRPPAGAVPASPARSPRVERALLGSVTERVARLVERPVVIVKGEDDE